ncbi:MAG: DUF3048 domain-containing protein [Firmicutes bacterium]|nr:DUF3048 domain-containing protein [Bacillota bacterium]
MRQGKGGAAARVLVLLTALAVLAAGCAGPRSAGTVMSEAAASEAAGQGGSEAAQGGAGAGAGSEAASEAAPFTPFAVIIDNERHARPQSGLDGAAIVVEMPAEGGITRYFAVFTKDPGTAIGPVRSARIYFNRLAHLWKLPVAHAGGNRDALADWRAHARYDIDGIYTNGAAFYRDSRRKAPHNLYTTAAKIEEVLAQRKLEARAPAVPLGPAAGGEAASGVEIRFPGGETVTWRAGADGRWQRETGGRAETVEGGTPLAADDVIVVVAPVRPDPDPWTVGAIDVQWEKAGRAWLLRNGQAVAGTMRFTAEGVAFQDADGRPAGLSAGSLWVEVVPAEDDVTILP